MPIRYSDLGGDRRISSIVFAGSHDASITSGKWNAKTQDKDIKGQLNCGVRIFDLRIIGRTRGDGGSLVGYHGSKGKTKTMSVHNAHTGKNYADQKYRKSMNLGTFGMKLSDMLEQAQEFVDRTNEFAIFKFDKCENYEMIADYCISILGRNIFTSRANREFGKVTLDELGKKVVCVFPDDACAQIARGGLGPQHGILGFRSLKGADGAPKPYDGTYPGLQYIGKGGTKLVGNHRKSTKIKENIDKQRDIMMQMAQSGTDDPANVLGMMYWTTTGLAGSIKSRNKQMWNKVNVKRMQDLWTGGLEAAIETQMQRDHIKTMRYSKSGANDHAYSTRMKAFFPNIVMIDFADEGKCQTIYELNHVAYRHLRDAWKTMRDEHGFA